MTVREREEDATLVTLRKSGERGGAERERAATRADGDNETTRERERDATLVTKEE